jgi:hypothetical protein
MKIILEKIRGLNNEITKLILKRDNKSINESIYKFYFLEDMTYNKDDDIDELVYGMIEDKIHFKTEINDILIKKYVLFVKYFQIIDLDIIHLIINSMQQHSIMINMIYKKINKKFVDIEELRNFVTNEIDKFFGIDYYNNLLNTIYKNNEAKKTVIFVFNILYNLSLIDSINNLKKTAIIV